MKKCFKNEMFLGQIIAKPSFLNYFFAKNEFHCSFAVPGPTARRRRRSRRNKDTPRYTMISRRVAHARTQRNANTNTKHDFPVGGVTKDSPPQPPTVSDPRGDICVESDFEVESTELLHANFKFKKISFYDVIS